MTRTFGAFLAYYSLFFILFFLLFVLTDAAIGVIIGKKLQEVRNNVDVYLQQYGS